MKHMTRQEQVHYNDLLNLRPGTKPRNLRKDARRLAKGLDAICLRPKCPKPSGTYEGITDTTAYWWGV